MSTDRLTRSFSQILDWKDRSKERSPGRVVRPPTPGTQALIGGSRNDRRERPAAPRRRKKRMSAASVAGCRDPRKSGGVKKVGIKLAAQHTAPRLRFPFPYRIERKRKRETAAVIPGFTRQSRSPTFL